MRSNLRVDRRYVGVIRQFKFQLDRLISTRGSSKSFNELFGSFKTKYSKILTPENQRQLDLLFHPNIDGDAQIRLYRSIVKSVGPRVKEIISRQEKILI